MRQVEPVISNRLDCGIEPLGREAAAIVIAGAAANGPAAQCPDHLAAHLSLPQCITVVVTQTVERGFLRVGSDGRASQVSAEPLRERVRVVAIGAGPEVREDTAAAGLLHCLPVAQEADTLQ